MKMNEEIKAILDRIKKHYVLDEGQDIILLNYITNLQEENQKLKEQLNCKEYFSSTMPENTEFVILTKNNYDRQQKDLALENIELKEENQKLNKIIDELENYLKVGIAMNFNMNNNKFSDQTIDNYNDILNKLTELKKEVE